MHNEDTDFVVEPNKPSKLARIKATAITTGIFVVPTVVMLGASYAGFKTSQNQLEAAKLNLEAAKLNKA